MNYQNPSVELDIILSMENTIPKQEFIKKLKDFNTKLEEDIVFEFDRSIAEQEIIKTAYSILNL